MRIMDRPEFDQKGEVLTMAPDVLVRDAAIAMSERNYGAVVVVSPENKPVGIVTERDFLRRLLARSLDPATTPLSEVMTKDLKLARPEDDLLAWLRQMSNDRFRHVPVVDHDGHIVTMMSQGDFVSYTWPELLSRLREQAKATMELSPSIFFAITGILLFLMGVMLTVLMVS